MALSADGHALHQILSSRNIPAGAGLFAGVLCLTILRKSRGGSAGNQSERDGGCE
jgi:hypothetical protein